jgi:hypothetical protein
VFSLLASGPRLFPALAYSAAPICCCGVQTDNGPEPEITKPSNGKEVVQSAPGIIEIIEEMLALG